MLQAMRNKFQRKIHDLAERRNEEQPRRVFGFNSVLQIYTQLTWPIYVSENLTDQKNNEILTRTEFPMV